eukprot:1122867-Pelagomonas_calceolata.AAC.2
MDFTMTPPQIVLSGPFLVLVAGTKEQVACSSGKLCACHTGKKAAKQLVILAQVKGEDSRKKKRKKEVHAGQHPARIKERPNISANTNGVSHQRRSNQSNVDLAGCQPSVQIIGKERITEWIGGRTAPT